MSNNSGGHTSESTQTFQQDANSSSFGRFTKSKVNELPTILSVSNQQPGLLMIKNANSFNNQITRPGFLNLDNAQVVFGLNDGNQFAQQANQTHNFDYSRTVPAYAIFSPSPNDVNQAELVQLTVGPLPLDLSLLQKHSNLLNQVPDCTIKDNNKFLIKDKDGVVRMDAEKQKPSRCHCFSWIILIGVFALIIYLFWFFLSH